MPSALEIQIALHYATRLGPYAEHDRNHRYSPAVLKTIANFLAFGYLANASAEDHAKYGSDYVKTEALDVWADALRNVRMPQRCTGWVIPEGKADEPIVNGEGWRRK